MWDRLQFSKEATFHVVHMDVPQWYLMNRGLVLRRLLSPNNVPFASQTQGKQSNTNLRIAFKLGGHGDGPRLLHMNFVGLELATMIVLITNKPCLGKGFLRNSAKDQNLAPSTGYTLWIIWIEGNDKVFNHEQ